MEKSPQDGQEELKEPGLEEEGPFDIIKPYKEGLMKKLRDAYPDSTAAELAAKATHYLIPDNPLDLARSAAGAASAGKDALSSIVQTVKFPTLKTEDVKRVFKGAGSESATTSAFKNLSPEMQQMKRKSAIEALKVKGPPGTAPVAALKETLEKE